MDVLLYWAAGIVTVGGALALLWRMITAGIKTGKKWDLFLEDWHGTEARPGRPAVPGIMQRMVDLEEGLRIIRHEVFPNSGGSLRDAVDRLEKQATELVATIPSPRNSPEGVPWPLNSASAGK
jgi:hypothetical protein